MKIRVLDFIFCLFLASCSKSGSFKTETVNGINDNTNVSSVRISNFKPEIADSIKSFISRDTNHVFCIYFNRQRAATNVFVFPISNSGSFVNNTPFSLEVVNDKLLCYYNGVESLLSDSGRDRTKYQNIIGVFLRKYGIKDQPRVIDPEVYQMRIEKDSVYQIDDIKTRAAFEGLDLIDEIFVPPVIK
jgi:hypothetical protein